MESNAPEQAPTPSNVKNTQVQPLIFFLVPLIIILISLALFGGFLWGKKNCQPLPTNGSGNNLSTPTPPMSFIWLKAYEDSGLSFEYPAGWHVYRQWILSQENPPIVTYINSQPIYYVDPNEGGIADITIYSNSGYDNPQAKLEETLEKARNQITNLEETTLEVQGVTVYKLSGSYVWEGKGTFQLERYYTLLPESNNLNSRIVSFELTDFGKGDFNEKSQVLKHVVETLTFK